MRIKIATYVPLSPDKVLSGFNQSLFLELAPPFPKVKVLRFDGCEKGDIVEIQLLLPIWPQLWRSHITDNGALPNGGHFFVDAAEGSDLPFFLGKWKHEHLMEADGTGTKIIDQINYEGRYSWLTPLLWPVLWMQFYLRKPIYQRIFNA